MNLVNLSPLHLHVRREARRRFNANPSKAYQRYIREVYFEYRERPAASLADAHVVPITNQRAAEIILKHEHLGTMAAGTIACYGLRYENQLIGVVCFAKGGSSQALKTIHPDPSKVVLLARGTCAPHAPHNSASFLIRRACKQASKDYGWTHFIGYSDEQAGERGQIYKACNWKCLGKSKQGIKTAFISPTGQRMSSYSFNRKSDKKFYALGWDGEEGKYAFLRRLGWTEHTEEIKTRWLWIEPKTLTATA